MAVEAERVVVTLLADTKGLDIAVSRSTAQFERGMSTIEKSAARAEGQIIRSAGAIAYSQRNLGRQIADVGASLASGSSPFLILAQQAPQFADALADSQGRAARFASFFAGPWGAALLAGVSVVGMLIPKLFDLGKAHDSAKQAADAQAKAEQQLNDVLQGTIARGEQARINALGLAQAHVLEARAALNAAKAQLQLAKARASAAAVTERFAPATMQIPGRGAASTAELASRRQLDLDIAQIDLNAAELKQRNLEGIAATARGIEAQKDKTKSDKAAATAQRRAEAAAKREAREAERRSDQQRQGMAELLRGRVDLAAAEADLTANTRDQDQVQRDRIEAERKISRAEISDRGGLSAAQRQELLDITNRTASARTRKVNADEAQRYLDEELKLRQADLGVQRDLANGEQGLADTTADRKRIALRLLGLAVQQERAELEAVLASQQATDVQKQIAQKRLDGLAAISNLDRARTDRDFESPGARYIRDIRKSAAQFDENVEGITVDGLERLNDELADAIFGAKSLGDAFSDVAKRIISDLARIAIQRSIIEPLAGMLFGGSPVIARGASGTASSVGSSIAKGLFGRASGGYVAPGQTVRVNEGGGRPELLRMGSQGGTVIPLGQTRAVAPQAAASREPITIQLVTRKGETFDVDVLSVTGPAVVQYVDAVRPQIARETMAGTVAEIGRMRL